MEDRALHALDKVVEYLGHERDRYSKIICNAGFEYSSKEIKEAKLIFKFIIKVIDVICESYLEEEEK